MDTDTLDAQAYEVFAQFGTGRPLQYVGSVRGVDGPLAWQAAKEAYTRREDCTALWVLPRTSILTGDEHDPLVLARGSSRKYRQSRYPSSRRRARAKAEETSEVTQ